MTTTGNRARAANDTGELVSAAQVAELRSLMNETRILESSGPGEESTGPHDDRGATGIGI